jgi:hypothetical protein
VTVATATNMTAAFAASSMDAEFFCNSSRGDDQRQART